MKKITPNGTSHFFKLICLIFLAAGCCLAVQAVDYLGASNVLYQVKERNANPDEKPAKPDEQTQLRDDLKVFSQSVTNFPPAEAAARWLTFVDRAVKNQQQSFRNNNPSGIPIQAEDLLGALPPPAAWNDLAKAIA